MLNTIQLPSLISMNEEVNSSEVSAFGGAAVLEAERNSGYPCVTFNVTVSIKYFWNCRKPIMPFVADPLLMVLQMFEYCPSFAFSMWIDTIQEQMSLNDMASIWEAASVPKYA